MMRILRDTLLKVIPAVAVMAFGSVTAQGETMKPRVQSQRLAELETRLNSPTRSAEDVISEQPEGELRIFSREAVGFYPGPGGTVQESYITGHCSYVVYAPDGKTVYFKDPILTMARGTWIKGEISSNGQKIVCKNDQTIFWSDEWSDGTSAGLKVAVLKADPYEMEGEQFVTWVRDDSVTEFTYAISGNNMMLELYGEQILGVQWTDNDEEWVPYATHSDSYEIFSDKKVELPNGMPLNPYHAHGYEYADGVDYWDYACEGGFDGDTFYLKGLFRELPDAVISGKRIGANIEFTGRQYLGTWEGYHMYFMPCTMTFNSEYGSMDLTLVQKVTLTYDPSTQFIDGKGSAFSFNAGKNRLHYRKMYHNPTFKAYSDTPGQPKNPIIDYSDMRDFTADDDSGWFTIFVELPLETTEGEFINPDNMVYNLFVDDDEIVEVHAYIDELGRECYPKVEGCFTDIPYFYTDDYDFHKGNVHCVHYYGKHRRYGIRTVNVLNGQRSYSDIMYSNKTSSKYSGIESAEAETQNVASYRYFDLTGRAIESPASAKGLVIRIAEFEDGSTKAEKLMVK